MEKKKIDRQGWKPEGTPNSILSIDMSSIPEDFDIDKFAEEWRNYKSQIIYTEPNTALELIQEIRDGIKLFIAKSDEDQELQDNLCFLEGKALLGHLLIKLIFLKKELVK